jgi:hypothetical protein
VCGGSLLRQGSLAPHSRTEIPLTQGKVARIDAEGWPLILDVGVDEHTVAVEGEEGPVLRHHRREPRVLTDAQEAELVFGQCGRDDDPAFVLEGDVAPVEELVVLGKDQKAVVAVEPLRVRRAPPGFDVRGHEDGGHLDTGHGAPRAPQFQQELAETALTDAGLAQFLPLRDLGHRVDLTSEPLQVVGRALVVLEPEDELARRVGPPDDVEEKDPAFVLERAVVDLAVEQVNLLAGLLGIDYPVVRAVLLLPLPEQEVATQVVLVLRQCLLLDAGDKEDDDLLALGRHDALADRVVRLIPPLLGQFRPCVFGSDLQEGHVHGEVSPANDNCLIQGKCRPMAL